MGSGEQRRRATSGQTAWLLAALAVAGCTEYSSVERADAGSDAGSGSTDAASDAPVDLGPPDGPSCAAIKAARPDAASGRYVIDPDGAGGEPAFAATCDMIDDGGGWMLVTDAMIGAVQDVYTTRVKTVDPNGGVRFRLYATIKACGEVTQDPADLTVVRDVVPWTQIRARYVFEGGAACWKILGGMPPAEPVSHRLAPFDATKDTIRDQVRMGGSAGAGFSGALDRCDNETSNFWHPLNGLERRSALVVLRREASKEPAGLATQAGCIEAPGPGTQSATFWEYSEIYVR